MHGSSDTLFCNSALRWRLITSLLLVWAVGQPPGLWAQPTPKTLWQTHGPLRVSANGRFLVHADGEPFFWMGDTAWRLFEKSARELTATQPPVATYFKTRAAQGFTVLQTAILFSISANAYGQEPFVDNNFRQPLIVAGPDNDFWDMTDYLVDQAEANGLYLALLPVWSNSVPISHPLEQDSSVAYHYGHFLGNRYRLKPHLIWVMGGDAYQAGRDVDSPPRLRMIRAIAEGIDDGVNRIDRQDGTADYHSTLMSYHPKGWGQSSSAHLHQETWLDFNMVQTSTQFDFANDAFITRDYEKILPKPTLDSEVAYEYSMTLKESEKKREPNRRITPWDVRRAAYWALFAGAFGHTYGHRSFIQWTRQGETNAHGSDKPWFESLDAPGAVQVGYLRHLMISRPQLTRIPDQSLLTDGPGEGIAHAQATRSSDGSYALVYVPLGTPVSVRLDWLRGKRVKAQWFDPRQGTFSPIDTFTTKASMRFTPPTTGEGQDWVLVLDAL